MNQYVSYIHKIITFIKSDLLTREKLEHLTTLERVS